MRKPKVRPPRKGFASIGRHSMKPRGFDGNKERVEELRQRKPGTWSIVPAAAVCDRRLGRCSPLHVMVMLGKYQNADTGLCIPSLERIARLLGVTRRTVQRHIDSLIEAGHLIAMGRRRHNGGWTSNAYILLFHELVDDAEDAQDPQDDGGLPDTGQEPKSPSEPLMAGASDATPSVACPPADALPMDASTALAEGGMRRLVSHACDTECRNPCDTECRNNNTPSERPIEEPSAEADARARVGATGQEHDGEDGTAQADTEPEADAQHDARQGSGIVLRVRPNKGPPRPRDPVGDALRWIAGVTGAHVGNLWGYAMTWHDKLLAAGFTDQEAQDAIGEQGRLLEAFDERENLIDRMTHELEALAAVHKAQHGEAA